LVLLLLLLISLLFLVYTRVRCEIGVRSLFYRGRWARGGAETATGRDKVHEYDIFVCVSLYCYYYYYY